MIHMVLHIKFVKSRVEAIRELRAISPGSSSGWQTSAKNGLCQCPYSGVSFLGKEHQPQRTQSKAIGRLCAYTVLVS